MAVNKGRDHNAPDSGTTSAGFYIDAEGQRTNDPGTAVRGEILDYDGEDHPRRTWFFLQELEIKWLPMSEAAFLLWVLVLLFAVWVGIGVLLGLL